MKINIYLMHFQLSIIVLGNTASRFLKMIMRISKVMHLCTNSTVTSSVNGRKFSVVNNSDLDWKSIDLIYVLIWKTKNCNMQYVGQTCRALQKRFGELS